MLTILRPHPPTSDLRDAVRRLMATGHEDNPWWVYDCAWCSFCWAEGAWDIDTMAHDADCPAMAVEAAMREVDDGDES